MKELSPKEILSLLDVVKKAVDAGADPVAAFDADGTLWNTDLGENFFKYQMKKKLVPLPENAWEHYQEWHDRDPIPAYLWLAQINAGKSLIDVLGWAKEALGEFKPKVPVFPHMVELIGGLRKMGIEVYIVTASVQWSIQPAAELVGVKPENVIGIRTKVNNGIVTEVPEGAVTWREGKVTGFQETTGGKNPVLAAGNSTGDLFLLGAASHVALANVLAAPHESYYSSEQDLLREAVRRGWYRIAKA